MHCRSFFERCCAHRCCVHFLAFICYGARTSGRRPCPGLGETPRVAAVCVWAVSARKTLYCVLGVLLRMGMAVRRPSPAKKVGIHPW